MNNNKPILKSKNRFVKALIAGLLVAGIAIAGVFGFTGCTNRGCQPPIEPPPIIDIIPDPEPEPEPEPVINITMEEFMEEHSDLAFSLANTYVKADLLDNKTPLSETWGFHANAEEELDSISLTYTYASSDTDRVIEVANATFINPIDLDKIVAEEVTSEDTIHQVTRQIAFEFDAKASYLDSDIADALFAALEADANATKYYSEVESDTENLRKFKVAVETSTAINVYTFSVVGETDAEILANLQSEANYESTQTATYPIGDNNSITFVTEKYEQEEFTPENVDEAVNDYSAEITSALDKNFLEAIGKKTFGNSFDKTKLMNTTWDIGNGETISEIKFISNYAKYEDAYLYSIGKITLGNPINVKTLNKDNIDEVFATAVTNATYTRDYTVTYNPAIQGTRNDLINAIFEAYGMTKECPEGAVRYYVDKGSFVDTTLKTETNRFQVIQISEEGVTEFSISIKNSSSDSEFIENLTNSGNYRLYDEKSYTMDGEKLVSTVNSAIEQVMDSQTSFDIIYTEEASM